MPAEIGGYRTQTPNNNENDEKIIKSFLLQVVLMQPF